MWRSTDLLASAAAAGKAVTTNLFGGSPLFFVPFFTFFFSFSLVFPSLFPSRSGSSNPAKGFEGALLVSANGRERHLQPSDTFPGL